MIPPEILFGLVPDHEPSEEFPLEPRLSDVDPESPGRRIGVWANFLRYRISRELAEDAELNKLLETSGFVATGVFRVPSTADADSFEGFPIVSGLQFGAVLFRGARAASADVDYISRISMETDGLHAPLVQTLATLNPHAPQQSTGYVAAVYEDDNGEGCGITAGHVVERYNPRQWVPVHCSDCGCPAKLAIRAPGLIDAAKITFPCGGPVHASGGNSPVVRGAVEGETVELHLGNSGKTICTVMQSLSTHSQILSSATPKHFLTNFHGHPGDSGSLVSGQDNGRGEPDLIGMYLGDASCKDRNGYFATYGFGLDLQQAAGILGASDLRGEFNV